MCYGVVSGAGATHEAAGVHHAFRRYGGFVAARDARAATGNASYGLLALWLFCQTCGARGSGSSRPQGNRLRRGQERDDPIPLGQQGDRVTSNAASSAAVKRSAASVLPKLRGRLFLKYAGLFVAVVCIALLTNGLFEIWFSYQEHKASLVRIQREQAESAAAKIGQFIKEIESQIGWTTQLLWSAETIEQHRFDALRLLRQVPAITELVEVDGAGKEQLRVSRVAMDVVGSGLDLSKKPKFIEAVKKKVYYGPVYFRRESEPYMTLALAGARRHAGVSIAEVNLKFIWDVVSKIKVGEHGHAYVVDGKGRLIAPGAAQHQHDASRASAGSAAR